MIEFNDRRIKNPKLYPAEPKPGDAAVIRPGNPGRRPAAVKATKKALKAGVALNVANALAAKAGKPNGTQEHIDKAFALRSKGQKMRNQAVSVLEKTQTPISSSPNKMNKKMKKRIAQSKKARGI